MRYVNYITEKFDYVNNIAERDISNYFYDRFRNTFVITSVQAQVVFPLDDGELYVPQNRIILTLSNFEQPNTDVFVTPGTEIYLPFTPGKTIPSVNFNVCEQMGVIGDIKEPPGKYWHKFKLPRPNREGGFLGCTLKLTFRLESFNNQP